MTKKLNSIVAIAGNFKFSLCFTCKYRVICNDNLADYWRVPTGHFTSNFGTISNYSSRLVFAFECFEHCSISHFSTSPNIHVFFLKYTKLTHVIKILLTVEVDTLHRAELDQQVFRIDGSGRMSTPNHKFLRRYLPVQTTPPRLTINNDLRHLAMLPHSPLKQTNSNPAQEELPPQPSPAKPLTGLTPAAMTPDHTSPKPCIPQLPPSNLTPSPVSDLERAIAGLAQSAQKCPLQIRCLGHFGALQIL